MVVFDNGMAAFGDVEYIIEKLSSIFSISLSLELSGFYSQCIQKTFRSAIRSSMDKLDLVRLCTVDR